MSAKPMQKQITVQDVAGADVTVTIQELSVGATEATESKGVLAYVKAGVLPVDHAKLANLSQRRGGGLRKLEKAIIDLTYGGEESQGN